MMTRKCKVWALGAILCSLGVLWDSPSWSQGVFVRNDAFDFRGEHELRFGFTGDDPTTAYATIESDVEFQLLKLRAVTNNHKVWAGNQTWFVAHIKVDVNNDGAWDLEVDNGSDGSISHLYPVPQGRYATHTVRIYVEFADIAGRIDNDWKRTLTCNIRILAPPRVYVDGAGNVLLQVRDEETSGLKPVVFTDGFDASNDRFPEYHYRALEELIEVDLRAGLGYTVFILDYDDGGADLRQNADVVRRALTKVHELCPSYEIALCGLSMGGLVSRYALAKSEAEHVPHHVGLFLSFDSPQDQANVNPDLQDFIKGRNPNDSPAIAKMQTLLGSMAAKQMLSYNTYDLAHAARLAFFSELNGLNGDGYPHQSYNVAIANGSYNATWGWNLELEPLGKFTIYSYGMDALVENTFFARKLDVGTGSKMNLAQQNHGIRTFFHQPFLHAYYSFVIDYDPVFIPTFSALHLKEPYTINQSTGSITSHPFSAFDDSLVHGVPRYHTELTTNSRDQLLDWLNRTFEVTVEYDLPEGGSVSPETQYLNVLGDKTVSISPKTVSLGGRELTYEFVEWDDGSRENPRRIYPWRDVTYPWQSYARKAVMKVRQATTSSGATWASGPQRIAQDFDWVGPTYHAVYESGGRIWHLRNRHNAGWEMERLISAGVGSAMDPAIATYSTAVEDQIQVSVAWMQDGIKYRESAYDNGVAWGPIREIYGAGKPMLPSGRLALVWAQEGAAVAYYKQPGINDSDMPLEVPGTVGNVSSAAVWAAGTFDFKVACARDNTIYVSGFRDPNWENFYIEPQATESPVPVSTVGWAATNPAIVGSGSNLFVAWEESYQGTCRIAFRQRTGSTWSAPVFFDHPAHVQTKPALGIDYGAGRLNLLWQCNDHIAQTSRGLTGSVWAPAAQLGPGRAASITYTTSNTGGVNKPKPVGMWTSGGAAPYGMVLSENDLSDATPPGAISVQPDIVGPNSIYFIWWATADDDVLPVSGPAQWFDFRKSPFPINDENGWSFAGPVSGVPTPGPFGTLHHLTVTDLSPCTIYHFSLRAEDDRPNLAALPPDLQVQTTCGGWGGGGEYSAREVDGRAEGGALLASGASVGSSVAPLVVETRRGDDNKWQVMLRLATEADRLDPTAWAITVERERPDGGRDALGEFTPDDSEQMLGLCALREGGRLAVPGFAQVERVMARVRRDGQDYALADARHSRLGALGAAFVAAGGGVELTTGDVIDLTYAPSTEALEDPASWYVLVRRQGTAPPTPFSRGRSPGESLPKSFALHQNRPNPFSGSTAIHFELPAPSRVRLEIFDAQGRLVRTLLDGEHPAGFHSIEWDHRTDAARDLGAGVYLYRIQAGSFRDQKKMVLLAR